MTVLEYQLTDRNLKIPKIEGRGRYFPTPGTISTHATVQYSVVQYTSKVQCSTRSMQHHSIGNKLIGNRFTSGRITLTCNQLGCFRESHLESVVVSSVLLYSLQPCITCFLSFSLVSLYCCAVLLAVVVEVECYPASYLPDYPCPAPLLRHYQTSTRAAITMMMTKLC